MYTSPAAGGGSLFFHARPTNISDRIRHPFEPAGLVPLKWVAASLILLLGLADGARSYGLNLPFDGNTSWHVVGRSQFETTSNSIIINRGFAVSDQAWDDVELTFRARMPAEAEQVQIWGGFRCRDRDSRYVFALRGGHDNDVYLARYAPDGGAKFLGFAPLDFKPVPGTWYRLRVMTVGNRIQIYLNDETLPRINVVDKDASWTSGGVILGGGWLPVEFADVQARTLTRSERAAFTDIGNARWQPPMEDKEAIRRQQRTAYTPVKFPLLNPERTRCSLTGNWLFKPDYELRSGETPIQADYDDGNWHVMPVPSFWTPGLSWLHGETNFPVTDEFSMTKGVAGSLFVQEIKRCDAYTFDWRKTRAAWYREHLEMPGDLEGKHFELCFNAIAKVSEVWVNGKRVGGHTGMFGQVQCDVTDAVQPGGNVIAVHVISQPESSKAVANPVLGVAVTVEVTSAMLHSLPHGMFQDDVGGIWQPVTLTATAPIYASDTFIQTDLHGATIHLDIQNHSHDSAGVAVGYSIVSKKDGSLLYSNGAAANVTTHPGEITSVKMNTPQLNPQLWSPQNPNLYQLNVFLTQRGVEMDRVPTTFGFRTFRVDGDKLLLNGQPFWLRGANPFPNTLRPNDPELARRFMEIAKAGNVAVTRSHIVPFTSTWLDAADETGMGVSFEGTWPWLMLEGPPPDGDLVKLWRAELISLIHEYRNHPSILFWTVNNEMKFEQFDQNRPELLQQKWNILDETVKEIRQADPSRPVVADSSYVRQAASKGFNSVVEPEHLDDGDMDDAHHYYGWYNESFFHFYDGEYAREHTPGRPLISQEMSTGYSNNDDGHPVRFYLFKHYTPQALVGDDAYENADPAIFLRRQAFMTKELVETLRRSNHADTAGLLLFSYFTWFQTPWSSTKIKPWPAYYALKTAMQPVLVSAELYGRHFYAGDTIHRRVCVVNDADDGQAITNGEIQWEVKSGDKILAQGQMKAPTIKYYERQWLEADFAMPKDLSSGRMDGQLVLRLKANGQILSENNYDITLASHEWAQGDKSKSSSIQLWNPAGSGTQELLEAGVKTIDSLSAADPAGLLVVGNLYDRSLTGEEMTQLRDYVSAGGRVLMLHPGRTLARLFPDQIDSFKPKAGEIVTQRIPESRAFDGLEPLDISWFEENSRDLPVACTGVFRIGSTRTDVRALAWQCDIHAYLKRTSEINNYSGSPLVEIRSGKGMLLASELNLEAGRTDPIAQRLLMNCLACLRTMDSPPF